jgi:glutathione synthase/RimK-type ligase-like ATP-grasp enzyme
MFSTVRKIARENGKTSAGVFFDMIFCGLRYGAGYVDYKIFDFVRLSPKQRKTFVTRGINNEFIRKLNNKADYYKFENKTVFNSIFEKYIGRDWVCLKDITADEFAGFLERNPVVIAKPVDSICGKGITKISVTESTDITGLYGELIKNNQLLAEEYIVQHEALSKLHPHSVNTLRFMTIANPDKVHVMFRALRVGCGGNVVDNFNAGGMFVLLNADGVVVSDAINKNTDMFAVHPTTQVAFKGYEIPLFKEAEEMVKEAARLVPGIRYVSWDVAVTVNRPVFVEANHNPGYDLLQSKVWLMENEYGRLEDFVRCIGNKG